MQTNKNEWIYKIKPQMLVCYFEQNICIRESAA